MESNSLTALNHAVTVGSILAFKISVLIVGYLIAKLGYSLLIKGVTGEFRFRAGIKGGSADLVSASPGLFFILMATILIGVAVFKDKPFKTQWSGGSAATGSGEYAEKLSEIDSLRTEMSKKPPPLADTDEEVSDEQ